MDFSVEFIGASCNLTYNCLELSSSQVIFGANHALTVYDLQTKKVVKTTVKHAGRINCIRFLRDCNNEFVLSSGADGQLIAWHADASEDSDITKSNSKVVSEVKFCYQSKPPVPIIVCDGVLLNRTKCTFGYITSLSSVFVGSADLHSGDVSIFQEINLNRSVALDIFFEKLEPDDLMMGLGMDSGEVGLYGYSQEEVTKNEFTKICSLNKHEDWVRCLAITTLENGEKLLATGGQDSFIAVWRCKGENVSAEDFEFQVVEFKKHKIIFDSMIIGHEGWVNSLQWNDKGELLSCSSDHTIIIWENIEQIWIEKIRLGVVGGQIPGSFCARFNENFVVTSGFQGAIQIWSWSEEMCDWVIEPSVTGHFKCVSDLDYDRDGSFVVTTSEDQTTRIFAPWGENRWHEISRPQVHGHDIFAITCAGDFLVSGAEEKILRAFQPTDIFVANYKETSGLSLSIANVSEIASVPALGLSNLTQPQHVDVSNKRLEEKLEEDFLRSQTLWPESSKLYGHGYEICKVSASRVDPIIVSGCRSTKEQFSSIILWSVSTWKNLGEFTFHKLNVTDLEFSKNGKRLLSVSRDRTWALWKVIGPSESHSQFSLDLVENYAAHTRALTVGTWAPSSAFFVTGGRDKRVIVWKTEKPEEMKDYVKIAVETFQTSVTAAAVNEENMIAVGLESGIITILSLTLEVESKPKLACLLTLSNSDAHHGLVTRLRFNPCKKSQLASASADHSVKIYSLN